MVRTKQQPCSTENALRNENFETVANDEMLLESLQMLWNNRMEIFKISDETKMPESKYNLRRISKKTSRGNKQPFVVNKRQQRIYEVELLCKSRPSRIFPGKLEYLTQWRGYKRRTWNQASDFLGAALQQMMQNCQ
jgi:hypothetical protein